MIISCVMQVCANAFAQTRGLSKRGGLAWNRNFLF